MTPEQWRSLLIVSIMGGIVGAVLVQTWYKLRNPDK